MRILGSNVKFNVSRSKFKFSSLHGRPIAGLLLPVSFDPKGFGIHAILQVHDELYDWQLECSTVVGATMVIQGLGQRRKYKECRRFVHLFLPYPVGKIRLFQRGSALLELAM